MLSGTEGLPLVPHCQSLATGSGGGEVVRESKTSAGVVSFDIEQSSREFSYGNPRSSCGVGTPPVKEIWWGTNSLHYNMNSQWGNVPSRG